MLIDKVYNNNVVQVITDQGQEMIVMGKGLGFGKKVGDAINPDLIEKLFRLYDNNMANELSRVFVDLPAEEIDLVIELIGQAQDSLQEEFDIALYIALADHLHYAIERNRQGLHLQNPLAWEVRKFFSEEFQIGKDALQLIQTKLGVCLDDSEAASIALHLINARKDGKLVQKNQAMCKAIIDILEIVRLHFGTIDDEESTSYHRFITHVQYFAQRVVNGVIQGSNDAFLYEQVKGNYPQAFACTEKIKAYVAKQYDFTMSPDEQVYLTIHIQRLEMSKNN